MRFMLIRKADKSTEAGAMPSQQLLTKMLNYMGEMGKEGILLAGEVLQPSSKGARVKFSSGQPTVIDGPFTETKELIAGFTMIQVNARQEAIDRVNAGPLPMATAMSKSKSANCSKPRTSALSLLPKCAKPRRRGAFNGEKRGSLASASLQYFS